MKLIKSLLTLLGASLLASSIAFANQAVDPHASPNDFLDSIAQNMLNAVKDNPDALAGDTATITELVRKYALPYVDMNKTTRLAAGLNWRKASDQQKTDLTAAFTGTLIRTYSGAFTRVNKNTSITVKPFRGDANADDAVVRTSISQSNSAPISVDYRLEKTDDGWKVYDLNVEGIWLIQNYRNQFTQEINRSGIAGLIKALTK